MQDKQTDTYWSIMSGQAEAGSLKGTKLVELPVSEKLTWREWVTAHPETLVLSVRGIVDPKRSPYESYFTDSNGFRGAVARDNRLQTKHPIFAFLHGDQAHAVDHSRIVGGGPYELSGGLSVFLYRESGDELFRGTAAFQSAAGFKRQDGSWIELGTGARFDPETREFTGGRVMRLNGFDTFWYTWSLTNPNTTLLR
jgi:hypothetical protein